MQNIFVYGTLKRGYEYAAPLLDQEFLTEAATLAQYWMFDLGSYPGLVDADGQSGDSIAGEVYRVDAQCRQRLDEIECVDSGMYELREIRLKSGVGADSISDPVFAYFYLGPTCRLLCPLTSGFGVSHGLNRLKLGLTPNPYFSLGSAKSTVWRR